MTNMSTDNTYVDKRFDNIKHADRKDNDRKKYRGLVLKNKMKILLISDSKTDISIAAMNVNIGYNKDPDDLPGLAHLCEHMLPLETKECSQQNDYNEYLSQYGGYNNARTGLNSTNYYFNIIPKKLEGALDRFAQFFIAPLFRKDLIEKEINAIHSEYNENSTNDEWRLLALVKLSVKSDHPFSKFSIGNKKTLDEIPKEKNIKVKDRLEHFYKKYYSANIMSLCILGKESLDDLENMVVERFCNVKNMEVELSTYSECPFKDEDSNTLWLYVPIGDIGKIDIMFAFPEKREDQMSLEYIKHLLGHKSEGSLLSALKAKGWCSNVEAGDYSMDTSIHFFKVTFYPTMEGLDHTADIVQIMFQYIDMLKKNEPMKLIYDEIQLMSVINNRYNEKIHCLSVDDISRITCRMQECPMEEIFSKQRAWQSDLIKDLIKEHFTPQNIRIYVVAKACEGIGMNETEQWFDIKYSKMKIPEERMEIWNRADAADSSTELKLPPKNTFIPMKFDIKNETNEQPKIPEIVINTSLVKVWHKKDDVFRVPKATMIFHFVSPFAYMDPLSSNLTNVFVELLHESLNEYTHIANLAGLKLEITSTIYGIKMTIDGYDDHAFVLLEKSMDQMINFKIDPKWFETLKYKIKCRNFDDIELNTVNYLEMLLAEQHWLNNELLESIAPLRADRSLCDRLIKLFIPKLFSKMYVECLIYGNVTKDEAKGIGKLIKSMLKTKEPPIVPLLQNQLYREIKLENGCYIRFEEENKVQKTSSTIVYYAIGLRTTKSNMLLSLLNQIIEEPCYNTLRTTESLGYTVFSKICTIMMNGMQYLTVAVQGGYQPRYVEKRIDSFMKDMFKHISTMPKEKFNNHKKSLDSLYLKAPDTITSQGSLYWKEIESQAYNFNRVNIEKEHLKTITQKQLLQFFKKNILINTRRKLSVHVMPTAMAVERNLPDTARRITVTSSDNKIKKFDNLMSFKLSQKK